MVNLDDLDKICRVCLQNSFELSLLFDEQNSIDSVSLPDMISECTMYTVQRYDEFPHLICYECIGKVRTAYRFKRQFEASHRKLITFLEKSNKIITDIKTHSSNDKCIQTEESTLYPCEKCDEKFLNYLSLREHRLNSHKGTANLCRLCFKSFIRIGDLKNHIAVAHPESGHVTPNECTHCNKKFTRKDHVQRHMRNVHKLAVDIEAGIPKKIKTQPYESETLVETEIEYANLKNQDADVEFITNYESAGFEDTISNNTECMAANELCSSDEDGKPLSDLRNKSNDNFQVLENIKVELDTINSSEVHVPVIEEKTPQSISGCLKESTIHRHKCSECDKSFSRISHLRRHLMTHRQIKPFQCTICEKRFSRSDHLKIHLTKHDEHKPYRCDGCDRSYARLDLLKLHKEKKHNSTLSKSEICDYCNKSFSSTNYLRKHVRLHLDKNWTCKSCSLEFDSKQTLKEHSKTHHKEKPFLCSECGLRFIRRDYLLIHMRRHNGEKPYKCKYCDKAFPRGTDLNVHERYHTGEKTHLCTTCGKGFQRAYNLVVHMRVHTGEKPYECPTCSKKFAQCNDLKAHVRRHTGERYKCEICRAGFIQGYSLTQHKKKVHGIEVESRIRRVTKISSNDLNKPVTNKVSDDLLNVTDNRPKLEQS